MGPGNRRGFTFLEMMAVMSLLMLIVSTVAIRFDLTGFSSRSELDRLVSFLRTRQIEVLRTGRRRTVVVKPDQSVISVSGEEAGSAPSLKLNRWRITQPGESTRLTVAPTGVYGIDRLNLENDRGGKVTLAPHPLLGIRKVPSE